MGIFEQIWSANEKQFHENDKIISVGLNAGFDFATFLRDQRCAAQVTRIPGLTVQKTVKLSD